MDEHQLKQVQSIIKEIEMTEMQMQHVSRRIVSDSVKASTPYPPYTSHYVTITGFDEQEYENQVNRYEKRLISKRKKLMVALNEVTDFIEQINDSEIRQFLTLRYVEGWTWDRIARHFHYANESVPRLRVKRYLKSVRTAR